MLYIIRLNFRDYVKVNDRISGVSYDMLLSQTPVKPEDIMLDYIAEADTPEQANNIGRALILLCNNIYSVCADAFSCLTHPDEDAQRDFAALVKLLLQVFGYNENGEANISHIRALANVFNIDVIRENFNTHLQPENERVRYVLDRVIVDTVRLEAQTLLTDDHRNVNNLDIAIADRIKVLCKEGK